jgi:hypothetical protein
MLYYFEFELKLGLKLDPNPTLQAVYTAMFLGLLIPLISSIIPIKAALSKNLNDALDYSHSQTKAMLVNIIDPNSKNNTIIIIFGLISSIYGVVIYVLMPQCMLSLNFGLLLKIFFLILIGMLFGLVLITMNMQFLVESLITKLLFWWESKSIRILMLKNLISHRVRNSTTTLVYSLSLAFLVLCLVSYNLQLENLSTFFKKVNNDIRMIDVESNFRPQ